MVSYEPYVNECTTLLCDRLSEFASAKGIVDMGHWFQCYAFDVIGLITFSKRFGHLDAGNDIAGVISTLDKANLLSSLIGLYPSWFPMIFKFLSQRAAKGSNTPTGTAYVMWFAQSQIESRRHTDMAASDGPEDFIGKMLRKRAEGGGSRKTIDDQTLLSTAGANIAAGSDTTAITLSAVLYYLCCNPEMMRKLRAELDSHTSGGEALTFQKVQSLPYLQAVIKEALRMHPATGFTMPRIVPAGGCTIAGRFIPAGVSINPVLLGALPGPAGLTGPTRLWLINYLDHGRNKFLGRAPEQRCVW
jgi:cytochrome P450